MHGQNHMKVFVNVYSVEYLVQKNVFRNIGVCCNIYRHRWAPRCCTNV